MDWPDSSDAAPLGDGRGAVAVDRPESVDALRDMVARRASEGLALYPQGGKTALDYGGIPRRPGVALDLSLLDTVIDYPAADMTITVGAGITLAKLQEILATEGQFLPIDAPHPAQATLGGIYATNTCGPRRFGWGRPRDMIIGVSFVTADGKEVKGGGRVVKNVAGYDFPKLITGSMGTLGVITQMTLKVRPKPEASALVSITFEEISDAVKAVETLNTSATRPVAVDLLNRSAGQWVGLPSVGATLVVGFEDNAASVAWQVARIHDEIRAGNPRSLGDDEAARLWTELSEFSAKTIGRLSFVTSVPRSKASSFVGLDSSTWAIRIHAGSGIVHGHYLPDSPFEEIEKALDRIRSDHRATESTILSRCPTEWKDRLKVWGDRRGDWTIMEKIKAALDPSAVMNPGRFVGTI